MSPTYLPGVQGALLPTSLAPPSRRRWKGDCLWRHYARSEREGCLYVWGRPGQPHGTKVDGDTALPVLDSRHLRRE